MFLPRNLNLSFAGVHIIKSYIFFQLKGNIIDELMGIKINSKELITKVSIVVAMATKERDEISQASQVMVFSV